MRQTLAAAALDAALRPRTVIGAQLLLIAWAFGAGGLGVQQGITTAVVYGVIVFVACLAGGVVPVVAWFRRIRLPETSPRPLRETAAHA